MKKLHLFLFLGLISLFAVGCERDSKEVKSFSSFIVETPSLSSEEKAVFNYDGKNIIYEEGDIIYVSGDDQTNVPFSLHREGNETDGYRWVAQGSEVVHGSTFYWCYVSNNNTAPTYNSTKHSYYVNLDDGASAPVTNGIVMAGNTETNILTTTPSFAILYFTSTDVESYSSIKVGFEGGVVPKTFSISAEDGSFSDINNFSAASSENDHSMLTMKKRGNYYYIAVPINGASVTTKLYFEYTRTGQTPEQRVTSGQVTLTKGKVIRIPSEDMNNYPFDADGAGKYKFSVADGQYVRFSAGNLWFHPYKYAVGTDKAWIFTTPQYNMHTTAEENLIYGNSNYKNYIDLFAWATSGYSPADGMPAPYATSTDPEDYGNGTADMTGQMDWGYNYSLGRLGIYYGNGRTTISWRTLTIAEWQYLLGTSTERNGKWCHARINKGGGAYVYGLIIVPDSYTSSISATSINTGVLNTKTISQWESMEKKGAIFLPACGAINSSRNGVSNINVSGHYWSATHDDTDGARALSFVSNGSLSISYSAYERQRGLSVRLVTDDGAESAL